MCIYSYVYILFIFIYIAETVQAGNHFALSNYGTRWFLVYFFYEAISVLPFYLLFASTLIDNHAGVDIRSSASSREAVSRVRAAADDDDDEDDYEETRPGERAHRFG